MPPEPESVSQRIRARLQAKQQQFHANDNIADFIEPGELEELTKEVASKMAGVLESLVIDVEHDHNTRETARRVAKMYVNEVFRGVHTLKGIAGMFGYSELSEVAHQLEDLLDQVCLAVQVCDGVHAEMVAAGTAALPPRCLDKSNGQAG